MLVFYLKQRYVGRLLDNGTLAEDPSGLVDTWHEVVAFPDAAAAAEACYSSVVSTEIRKVLRVLPAYNATDYDSNTEPGPYFAADIYMYAIYSYHEAAIEFLQNYSSTATDALASVDDFVCSPEDATSYAFVVPENRDLRSTWLYRRSVQDLPDSSPMPPSPAVPRMYIPVFSGGTIGDALYDIADAIVEAAHCSEVRVYEASLEAVFTDGEIARVRALDVLRGRLGRH
jgi:hypothetical protein